MTEKTVNQRTLEILGTECVLHTLKLQYFFGLKTVWFNDVKVKISDPTRTAYYLHLTADVFPDITLKMETNYPGIIPESQGDNHETN